MKYCKIMQILLQISGRLLLLKSKIIEEEENVLPGNCKIFCKRSSSLPKRVLGSALNAKFRMLLFRVDEHPEEYDVARDDIEWPSNLCQFIIITGGI
jgi:hypothetical protein